MHKTIKQLLDQAYSLSLVELQIAAHLLPIAEWLVELHTGTSKTLM